MKQITINQLFDAKCIYDKQYEVREKDPDQARSLSERLIRTEVVCCATDGKEVYVASSPRSSRVTTRERLCLDEQGLAYYEWRLGAVVYPAYDSHFLGNTSFASAMGRFHQKGVIDILKKVKEEQHPLYERFYAFLDGLIIRLGEIKDAKDREYYFGDDTEIKRFSELDLEGFRYLTAREYEAIYNPDNHPTEEISITERQNVRCGDETKEEATFILWYSDFLCQNGYKQKIVPHLELEEQAFRRDLALFTDSLEKRVFRRVRKLQKIVDTPEKPGRISD